MNPKEGDCYRKQQNRSRGSETCHGDDALRREKETAGRYGVIVLPLCKINVTKEVMGSSLGSPPGVLAKYMSSMGWHNMTYGRMDVFVREMSPTKPRVSSAWPLIRTGNAVANVR